MCRLDGATNFECSQEMARMIRVEIPEYNKPFKHYFTLANEKRNTLQDTRGSESVTSSNR
jgi:hypothetical protein